MTSAIFSAVMAKSVSYILSVLMLISTLFPGPMGNYAKLEAEEFQLIYENTVHQTQDLTMTADVESILKLFGVEDLGELGIDVSGGLTVNATADSYCDYSKFDIFTETSFDASLDGFSVKDLSIIADEEYTALSPEVIALVSAIEGADSIPEEAKGKYFAISNGLADVASLGDEYEAMMLEELESIYGIADVVFGPVCEEDLTKIVKTFAEPQRKLYHATSVGGYDAYTYKVTGTNFLKAIDASLEKVGTLNFVNSFFNIVNSCLVAAGEDPLGGNDLAMAKAEILKAIPAIRAYIAPFIDANAEIPADIAEIEQYLPLIRSIADNSVITSRIYKTIADKYVRDLTFVVSDGKTTYVTFTEKQAVEKYFGEIPSFTKLVPEDKVFIPVYLPLDEDIDSLTDEEELANEYEDYEDYEDEGYTYDDIDGIEFIWTSFLAPGAVEQTIEGTFGAAYMNVKDSDPVPVDVVAVDLIMIGSRSYVEVGDAASLAGIECVISEDGKTAEWKFGDKSVSMDLTEVDGAKYVKVRDFEKLGAKVDYTEQMIPSELITTVDCLTYKASAAVISF